MKKLFFLFLFFTSMNSFSQFTKGTRTVGLNLGGIGFTNFQQGYNYGSIGTATTTNNSFNISLQPSMGKFFSDNLLVGGGPSLNFSTNKYSSRNNNYSGNTFTGGINVFGRYYFGAEGFMPYLQANTGVAFGGGSQKGNASGSLGSGQTYTSKYTEDFKSILNFAGGLGLGLTKLLNKNVGLDVGIAYQFNRRSFNYSSVNDVVYSSPASSEQQKSTYKYTGTTNNVALSAGILVFLDPKK
ncbi:MAG: hypothetical protein K2X48_20105 [Chitinophagaceae bacterium]|nr:hypothetical protein [Chitinophagaceae bacterium]